MGRDKGALRYHAEPQAIHTWRLLSEVCGAAFVSTNTRCAGLAPYSDLPLILDSDDYQGPSSGLRAAWEKHPDAAWLVLAVDMLLVDRALLEELVAARDLSAYATAFRHDDGVIEPLCTIWEPKARAPLVARVAAGDVSLRRFLEAHDVALVSTVTPEKLRSFDDRAAFAMLATELGSNRSEH